MIRALVFVLATLTAAISGLKEFHFDVIFSDGLRSARSLIVDNTSPETFVLDYKRFHVQAGASSTFNSFASKTGSIVKRSVSLTFESTKDGQPSNVRVTGRLFDDLIYANYLTGGYFLVAEFVNGGVNPAIGFDGDWNAGRFGIARGNATTTLRDDVLNLTVEHTWCGEAVGSKGNYQQISRQGISTSTLKVTAKASVVTNEPLLWKIPVTSLSINERQDITDETVVISTIIDKIRIPQKYIQSALHALNAHKVGDKYEVKCDKDNKISFVTNGRIVELDYAALVEADEEEQTCILKIEEAQDNGFVFGLPLFAGRGICFDLAKNEVVFYKAGI